MYTLHGIPSSQPPGPNGLSSSWLGPPNPTSPNSQPRSLSSICPGVTASPTPGCDLWSDCVAGTQTPKHTCTRRREPEPQPGKQLEMELDEETESN